MVGLARAIYNPRPGELAGTLRDPAELCRPALADRTAVESLLFDAFIRAAYRDDPEGRWKAQDAKRWLVFLARHLEFTIGSPNLAWWQLPLAVPGFALGTGVVIAAMIGIMAGVVAGDTGWAGGWDAGRGGGGSFGRGRDMGRDGDADCPQGAAKTSPSDPDTTTKTQHRRVRGRSWVRDRGWVGIFGAVIGAAVGVIEIALGVGVIAGVVVMAVWWTVDQGGDPLDSSSAASPLTVLAGDRRTGTALATIYAIVFGIAYAVLFGFTFAFGFAIPAAIAAGIVSGFTSITDDAAWPSYEMARIWLALCHRLPRSLMDFLTDAHRRGVLRQAGAVYQFRHIELQHRLANQEANEQQTNSPTA